MRSDVHGTGVGNKVGPVFFFAIFSPMGCHQLADQAPCVINCPALGGQVPLVVWSSDFIDGSHLLDRTGFRGGGGTRSSTMTSFMEVK